MFDPICKYLAEHFSADFATWLLGKEVSLSALAPSELSLEPIRADALIMLEGDENLLHIEFQTQPEPKIPFRMLDYWVRAKRRTPDKTIRQVVVYLNRSQSERVFQTVYEAENTTHRFEVIRLWEQPFESFLTAPGLLPLAILSRVNNREAALQEIARQIQSVPNRTEQANLVASTFVLAGLVLEEFVIQRVLQMDILAESPTYQYIINKGVEKGRAEGRVEALRSLIIKLLNLKLGQLSESITDQISQLSFPQLEQLGEAMLTFSTVEELTQHISSVQTQATDNAADSKQ